MKSRISSFKKSRDRGTGGMFVFCGVSALALLKRSLLVLLLLAVLTPFNAAADDTFGLLENGYEANRGLEDAEVKDPAGRGKTIRYLLSADSWTDDTLGLLEDGYEADKGLEGIEVKDPAGRGKTMRYLLSADSWTDDTLGLLEDGYEDTGGPALKWFKGTVKEGAVPPNLIVADDLAPTGDHQTIGAEEDLQFADEFEEEILLIADPIEPFNRGTFYINDKLYTWIFRPIAAGYGYVTPEKARVGVRRFFTNLAMPMRFVNDLLQFKLKFAGIEMARFLINTTVGVGGFTDPAEKWWHLYLHKEDFGQTLGFYGLGPGIYINWPFFGPSSIRDTVGMVGDLFLNPLTYVFPEDRAVSVGIDMYDRVNETSLNIGIYEHIKRDSLDPYVFIRNAYHQHRENAVKE